MIESEEILRRLTIGDRAYCRSLLVDEVPGVSHHLDARSLALLRLGATMTAGMAGPSGSSASPRRWRAGSGSMTSWRR